MRRIFESRISITFVLIVADAYKYGNDVRLSDFEQLNIKMSETSTLESSATTHKKNISIHMSKANKASV